MRTCSRDTYHGNIVNKRGKKFSPDGEMVLCDICEKRKELTASIVERALTKQVHIMIRDDVLTVIFQTISDHSGTHGKDVRQFVINYCPFCGRKLDTKTEGKAVPGYGLARLMNHDSTNRPYDHKWPCISRYNAVT